MRTWRLAVVLLLVGCDSFSAIPCDQCAQYGAVCDPATQTCKQTDAGGGCDGDCDLADLTPMCTPQAAATDCAAATPICGAGGTCRACSGAGDDSACAARSAATPRCQASTGTCVACLPASPNVESADCAPMTPICNSDATCRACRAHSECASGICVLDGGGAGVCVPMGGVALVDNGNMPVATCTAGRATRDGNSAATAYCDISEAVGKARPFVLVTGSSQPYSAITITDQSITIVGPGKSATTTARIFGAGIASAAITVNSGAQQVVLDGLNFGGDSITKGLRGVDCKNNTGTVANTTVVVRNSKFHDNAMEAILSSTCALTVDANQIGASSGTETGNAGGGINLSGSTTFVITNNIVTGNGGLSAPSAGVTMSNTSTGQFAFNTIVQNTVGAGVGGIDCGSGAMKTISDSIVWKNTTSSGTQFSAQCMLSNVVTVNGDDSRGSMSAMPPKFVGALDFHLVAGDAANLACCIDKVATPGTPNSSHDIDLSARPKGTGATPFDIGAHEVQ